MENKNPSGFLDDKKIKLIWIFLALLFCSASLILAFFTYKIISAKDAPPKPAENGRQSAPGADDPAGPWAERLLDGVLVRPGEDNLYPLGLTIDNHPDARPGSGLAGAGLVFEIEAEGGITRYLAFFAGSEAIEKIGPVRSARPYFIDYAREISALYAHVGGSPEALALMKKEKVLQIDEFYNGEYFWRDQNGFAPHNVYASSAGLYGYLEKRGLAEGKFFPWIYKDDLDLDRRPATATIEVKFGYKEYEVLWQYDRTNNEYVRYLGGKVHREADSRIISAKNIAVARVKGTVIDELMRLKMDTIGTGEALLCRDGFCLAAVWRKDSPSARLRFYDEAGKELAFNRGTTWVEVVRPAKEVIY